MWRNWGWGETQGSSLRKKSQKQEESRRFIKRLWGGPRGTTRSTLPRDTLFWSPINALSLWNAWRKRILRMALLAQGETEVPCVAPEMVMGGTRGMCFLNQRVWSPPLTPGQAGGLRLREVKPCYWDQTAVMKTCITSRDWRDPGLFIPNVLGVFSNPQIAKWGGSLLSKASSSPGVLHPILVTAVGFTECLPDAGHGCTHLLFQSSQHHV